MGTCSPYRKTVKVASIPRLSDASSQAKRSSLFSNLSSNLSKSQNPNSDFYELSLSESGFIKSRNYYHMDEISPRSKQ